MDIVQLAVRPDLLGIVAGWIYDKWWAADPASSVGTVEYLLKNHMTVDRIPLTLVGLVDGQPAGTTSLIERDKGVEARPETPWVAAVLTQPGFRGRGIATALMRETEMVARRIGLERIYLITEIEGFYSRLGWEPHLKYIVDHPDDLIMVRKL